jgi:hypothetical protein
VNGTAETVSAMLMTPCFSGVTVTTEILWLKSLQNFSFHYHGDFSGVIDTAEAITAGQ